MSWRTFRSKFEAIKVMLALTSREIADIACGAQVDAARRIDQGHAAKSDKATIQNCRKIIGAIDRGFGVRAAPIDGPVLIGLLERIATEEYGGHLTLMRFTTGWKVMLGTPMLDSMGHVEVAALDPHATLSDALRARLAQPNKRWAYDELESATADWASS